MVIPAIAGFISGDGRSFIEDRIRLGMVKLENFVFICLCTRLSVSLDKIGFGSA